MLSICIVNWNNRDFLRECLASVRACPPTVETVEVIVVDNASTDGSAEMVLREFAEVRLIAQATNTGYAAGNNIALEAARGEHLLLLNPDVRVLPGAFDAALDCFRERERVGASSVRFINPDGSLQRSLRGFPAPTALLFEIVGLSRLLPKSRRFGAYFMRWFGYDRKIDADQPMGTFLMIASTALDSVGFLDEQFPIFFNEVDWCYRAVRTGWRIVFSPDGEIIHYGGQGTRLAPKASMVRESHDSLARYYAKHYKDMLDPIAYGLIIAAIRFSRSLSLFRAR